MAALSTIRFHDDVVNEIVGSTGLRVVHAPRGFGKTRIFSDVKRRLGPHVVQVSGRDDEIAYRQLQGILTEFNEKDEGPPTILIDDVDHLLQDPKKWEERLKTLWGLKHHITSFDRRLCMTTSAPPLTLAEYSADFSDVFLQAEKNDIAAGRVRWKTSVKDSFEALPERPTSILIWGRVCGVSSELVDQWCDAAQDLTGGHPTLLDPAVQLLFSLLDAADRDQPSEAACDSAILEQAVRAELERTSVPYIQQRLASLSTDPAPGSLDALSFLMRLAQAEDSGEITKLPADVEQRLHTEGLVYMDIPRGRFRIVGRLVREQVVALHAPQKRGRQRVVVERLDGSTAELRLSGRMLELFNYLGARGGEYVPTSDLARASGLADDAAVRTVLHRLGRELGKAGVQDILENQYGKGYRLLMKSYVAF